jgi:hypothetical protein
MEWCSNYCDGSNWVTRKGGRVPTYIGGEAEAGSGLIGVSGGCGRDGGDGHAAGNGGAGASRVCRITAAGQGAGEITDGDQGVGLGGEEAEGRYSDGDDGRAAQSDVHLDQSFYSRTVRKTLKELFILFIHYSQSCSWLLRGRCPGSPHLLAATLQ